MQKSLALDHSIPESWLRAPDAWALAAPILADWDRQKERNQARWYRLAQERIELRATHRQRLYEIGGEV